MSRRDTFVGLCLSGDALLDEIDDFIDRWHDQPTGLELHDYLGMTLEEYSLWLRIPDTLPYIIAARREHLPLSIAVLAKCDEMRLLAKSDDQTMITRLRKWLKEKDEVK